MILFSQVSPTFVIAAKSKMERAQRGDSQSRSVSGYQCPRQRPQKQRLGAAARLFSTSGLQLWLLHTVRPEPSVCLICTLHRPLAEVAAGRQFKIKIQPGLQRIGARGDSGGEVFSNSQQGTGISCLRPDLISPAPATSSCETSTCELVIYKRLEETFLPDGEERSLGLHKSRRHRAVRPKDKMREEVSSEQE